MDTTPVVSDGEALDAALTIIAYSLYRGDDRLFRIHAARPGLFRDKAAQAAHDAAWQTLLAHIERGTSDHRLPPVASAERPVPEVG